MAQNLGNLFIDGESVIEDETGNHSLSINGATSIRTNTKAMGESSIYFDGNADYISVVDSDDWDFRDGDFTIDLWTRFADVTGRRSLINTQINDENDGFNFTLNNDTLVFITHGASGERILYFRFDIPSNILINTWYHMAVVRHNDTVKLYIDGVEKASAVMDYDILHDSPMILKIGEGMTWSGGTPDYWNDVYMHPFAGYMDNIRIVKGEALWTSNFNLTEESLLYITLEENPYIRPDNISSFYNSKGLRGKASEGFIRPTIKQFFMSTPDFEEIESALAIGDFYEGGYYMGDFNGYQLICAPIEGQSLKQWSWPAEAVPGADSFTDGYQNTLDLIADSASHLAAIFCVSLTIGGFTDWYLPAKDELNLLYINREALEAGGAGAFIDTTYYWASTEAVASKAWRQHLITGAVSDNYSATRQYYVRAIRRIAIE